VPCILVADDNTNIQKMVSLAFEDRGIKVVSVGNGEAAVRRIPELNPDLVLADIFMPVRNGYEVCEFVKKDQRFAHVPVILLVGAFDPLDEKEARRVGADGVLKKPFVPPDPLIAMAISALEKNPRVIAEMAKTKATLEPHALAEPQGPSHDAPFQAVAPPKMEVKPLPDFPEPSPEEAAVVYGFGKGQRTIDRHDLPGPNEPVAPVAKEDEENAEDAFDGAATTSDWRRNSMDFEIPADDAHRPAFSDDAFEPAPVVSKEDPASARNLAPETYPKPDSVAQEATGDTSATIVPAVSAWEAFSRQARQIAAFVTRTPEPQPSPEVTAAPVESSQAPTVATQVESSQAPAFARNPEPAAATAPAPEPQAQSQPVLAPTPTHWMDALASFSGSQPASGWVDALSEQSAHTQTAVEEPPVSAPAISHEPSLSAASSPEPAAQPEPEPHKNAFFAPEPSTAERASTFASQAAPQVQERSPEPVAFAEPQVGLESLDRSEDRPSLRDPDLVEPPAVRVTPEPLLIDEESGEPSASYGQHQEELTPLHTFSVPEPAVSAAESRAEETAEELSVTQPSAENAESFAPETEQRFQPEHPVDQPRAIEPLYDHLDERIPTVAPPNREALAEIPFLNPPPGFDPDAPEEHAASSDTVDAAVERVLERLEPQLHHLLAQGVLKPLIESLLRQELSKNEK
jgi:CheY-like chemotaxis protein